MLDLVQDMCPTEKKMMMIIIIIIIIKLLHLNLFKKNSSDIPLIPRTKKIRKSHRCRELPYFTHSLFSSSFFVLPPPFVHPSPTTFLLTWYPSCRAACLMAVCISSWVMNRYPWGGVPWLRLHGTLRVVRSPSTCLMWYWTSLAGLSNLAPSWMATVPSRCLDKM